jgi:hypothetical protein
MLSALIKTNADIKTTAKPAITRNRNKKKKYSVKPESFVPFNSVLMSAAPETFRAA